MSRILFAHLLATSASVTLAAEPPSLCTPAESTYFTCSTGIKIISMCASQDLSSTSGTLQYRFGTPDGKVELAFPSVPSHPSKAFKAYLSWFPKGGVSAIGFDIGKFSYSVFETHSVYGYNGAGVALGRDGVPLKKINCKTLPSKFSRLFYELRDLKLPEAELDHVGTE